MVSLLGIFNDLNDGRSPSAIREEKLQKEVDHHYSMLEDGAESIGRIGLGYQKRSETSNNPKKKKHLDDLFHRLLEHQRWLQERVDALQEQIEHLTERIEKHVERIDILDEFMSGFRGCGEY